MSKDYVIGKRYVYRDKSKGTTVFTLTEIGECCNDSVTDPVCKDLCPGKLFFSKGSGGKLTGVCGWHQYRKFPTC